MCVKKNVKRKNGAECIRRINLNKIRRSNKRVAEDKESLERNINDS